MTVTPWWCSSVTPLTHSTLVLGRKRFLIVHVTHNLGRIQVSSFKTISQQSGEPIWVRPKVESPKRWKWKVKVHVSANERSSAELNSNIVDGPRRKWSFEPKWAAMKQLSPLVCPPWVFETVPNISVSFQSFWPWWTVNFDQRVPNSDLTRIRY